VGYIVPIHGPLYMGSIYTNTLKSCMDLGAGAVPNCLFVYDMYNAN